MITDSHTNASFGLRCELETADSMAAAHQHDDIEINIAGSPIVYLQGGRTITIPAGKPSMFWACRPHQLITTSPVELLWLTVPTTTLLSWIPVLGEVLLTGDVVVGDATALTPGVEDVFRRWREDLRGGGPARRRAARLEIEAMVHRISASAHHSPMRGALSSDPARIGAMARYIAENFTTPLVIADVARHVHVHPNTAAKEFLRMMGATIPHYVSQFRVAEAQRLLLTSDLPVQVVRTRSGFRSAAAFHTQFLKANGMTPGEYRRRSSPGDRA